MTMQVYHQLGWRYQWGLQSLENDHAGDGIIIAPMRMKEGVIEGLAPGIRQNAIFDPQFFLPNNPKAGLEGYDFFPDNAADGFATSEYEESGAADCAVGCVRFQAEHGFRYVVIPTRYMSGMPTNYREQQSQLFVEPFIQAIHEVGGDVPPALLQLVLNQDMILDDEYLAGVLNWATGFEEIAGVYLIAEVSPRPKQIDNQQLLYALLQTVKSFRENELEVVLGYLNTESVLLSIADPTIVTMGCYENLRMFNIRTFQDAEKSGPPNPRLFCTGMLNWVDHNYWEAIEAELPGSRELVDKNSYLAEMFDSDFKWHFTKPALYKHHFIALYRVLSSLGALDEKERYEAVMELIHSARAHYAAIESAGIELDRDSDGGHLPAWATAANRFARRMGWRE